MANFFLPGGMVALVYAILKFVEMRFVLKQNKPIKELVREITLVYMSSILGIYTFSLLTPIVGKQTVAAFVGEPGF